MALVLFLYAFHRNLFCPGEPETIKVWPFDQGPQQVASEAKAKLHSMLRTRLENGDLAGMGERVMQLSRLLQATRFDPTIPYEPLLSLLAQQFPWLDLAHLPYRPWAPLPSSETGVVICVGDKDVIYAAHLISTLRNVLKSTLPIEIAYAGPDDLSITSRRALGGVDEDLTFVDLLGFYDEPLVGLENSGYAMKPFAMLASRFQKTILVDADVIFLRRPDLVFDEHSDLVRTGNLFWHDRFFHDYSEPKRMKWIKGLLNGRAPSSTLSNDLFWTSEIFHVAESGVVCTDKGKASAFMSLVFAASMNTKQIRNEIINLNMPGDKETYWLAAELSSSPYAFSGGYAGIIAPLSGITMSSSPNSSSSVCSLQILHFDHMRRPFWFNRSLRKNKSHEEAVYEPLTHYLLEEDLREKQPSWGYVGDEVWCAATSEGVQVEVWDDSSYERTVLDKMTMVAQGLDVEMVAALQGLEPRDLRWHPAG